MKEKFEQAKQLIEAKQYTKARQLLRTINHPTATAWLQKLDAIDPQFVVPDDEPQFVDPVTNINQQITLKKIGVGLLILIALQGVGINLMYLAGLLVPLFIVWLAYSSMKTSIKQSVVKEMESKQS